MRKSLIILISFIFLITITGCQGLIKKNMIGPKSEVEIKEEGLNLSFKKDTLSNVGATVLLTNNTNETITYDEAYEIEIKKEGDFHKINVKVEFNLVEKKLLPNETKELKINWENGYGKLSAGTYRIIKTLKNSKTEKFNVAIEFTIL